MKRTIVGAIAIFLIVAASGTPACSQTATAPTTGRYVDAPDLMSVIKRVLTPQGMLDPEFGKAIAKPSPYLGDFFGVQAIKDVTKENIKHDFVPKFASIEKEDEHSVELKFKYGWTGRFVVNSSLEVKGYASPVSHVYLSGDTWNEMLKNRDAFLGILKAEKLEERYLIPNPQYQDELVVARKLEAGGAPVAISRDPGLPGFDQSTNAVAIFPDAVHGNEAGFSAFLDFLKAHKCDWLGLEALTTSVQKQLDDYIQADEKSPEFAAADKAITEYFASGWDKRFENTKESHFMKVVQLMRANKSRVYGLEGVSLDYIIWRYGETPFGGAVRSYVWSKQVPTSGRGIVFGGSAHFTSDNPENFQDFLKDRNPEVKLYYMGGKK
jgi:hypothetical protein